MMRKWLLAAVIAGLMAPSTGMAKEGMWLPDQMPGQAEDIVRSGLSLPPEAMSNLDSFPLGAVVSLRWCTGSFVSPDGLIATNHHCVQSALQQHSTTERNLLTEGYLARSRAQELQTDTNHVVLITESMTDVTERVTGNLPDASDGAARRQQLSQNAQEVLAPCRTEPRYACSVHEFYGGQRYYLVKQIVLRDVRLVYAPHAMIGRYGGDDDNWEWPRQTGDFALLRAYVGPDGQNGFYNTANVPYRPRHYLKLAERPMQQNDFAMVLGYPGQTERHRIYDEARFAFQQYYPALQRYLVNLRNQINGAIQRDPSRAIDLATQLDAVNNVEKRVRGMLVHARRYRFLERKAAEEGQFVRWLEESPERRARYMPALQGLRTTLAEQFRRREFDFVMHQLDAVPRLASARAAYSRARGEEPYPIKTNDLANSTGLGEMKRQFERLPAPAREATDRAIVKAVLSYQAELPQERRMPALGRLAERAMRGGQDSLDRFVDAVFTQSTTDVDQTAFGRFSDDAEAFEQSQDPMIKLAVTVEQDWGSSRENRNELAGREQAYRSIYMQGRHAYARAKGRVLYPDANSTLRVSYGKVQGVQPADGKLYVPFTTLEGIIEKHTNVEPFDAPDKVLTLARRRVHGDYRNPRLGTVPVNTLSDLDITGGSSGSPVLNARGQLVGFLFDGIIEGLLSDWKFDQKKSRAIFVNTDYLLWTLTHVEEADHLLRELGRR